MKRYNCLDELQERLGSEATRNDAIKMYHFLASHDFELLEPGEFKDIPQELWDAGLKEISEGNYDQD